MDFKRFNGSTWETVRHKIYGSGTDSLTAFPAVIQASGEALTDYLISGNTVQDGTPTPESPVDVVGCGVWDETYQSYKLPLTVNGTEHPIYLGQVETTRWIKKLVLTGGESGWLLYQQSSPFWQYEVYQFWLDNIVDSIQYSSLYSTIAPFGVTSQSRQNYEYGCYIVSSGKGIAFQMAGAKDTFTNITAWKSYLAAQYAAGTPVTVWYVLAEPETAAVNEPIHKIGNYADTITMAQAGVTIPTSDGDNTISFGTTVQPSEMSATFKGWHPVQAAKQYDGNDWS